MKVKKGDTVKILAGKDRGKSGVVERIFPKDRRLVVTGINLQKVHARPRRRTPAGILTRPAPLPIARVMVICPRCQKATRIRIAVDQGSRRERMCRRCQEVWPSRKES